MPQTPTSTAAAPGPASPTLNPGKKSTVNIKYLQSIYISYIPPVLPIFWVMSQLNILCPSMVLRFFTNSKNNAFSAFLWLVGIII